MYDWSGVIDLVGDVLTLGSVGFVAGVLVPLLFRVVGYIVDSARAILEGESNNG